VDGARCRAEDLDLVQAGALTVCTDPPYPPFEFEDADAPSGYSGFDIDLMQEIADRLGLTLEVVEVGFDGLQSGATLAAGQCDVGAAAMTITEDRAENLNFSDPYYDSLQSLIVLADSDISSLADVEGESIGVQRGTTGAAYAEENAPEGTQIIDFDSGPDIFTAMQAGQIVAGLQDLPVNLEQVENDDSFQIVEEFDTGEQYGFAAASATTRWSTPSTRRSPRCATTARTTRSTSGTSRRRRVRSSETKHDRRGTRSRVPRRRPGGAACDPPSAATSGPWRAVRRVRRARWSASSGSRTGPASRRCSSTPRSRRRCSPRS
jgi:polar amino acid transport system substrate-binding protein